MNWPQVIAFGIPWLLMGARMLETRLPAVAKLRRVVPGRAARLGR